MIGILFVKKQQGTNKVSKSANIKYNQCDHVQGYLCTCVDRFYICSPNYD